jgi:hypothetical protein
MLYHYGEPSYMLYHYGSVIFLETQYKHRYSYPYEYLSLRHTYVYLIFMSTSERLSRLNLEIHKVGHQEQLTVDGNVTSH